MRMLGSICRAHSSVRLPVTAAREIIECLILGTKQPHDFQHSIFDANGSKLNIIYKILFASYIVGGKRIYVFDRNHLSISAKCALYAASNPVYPYIILPNATRSNSPALAFASPFSTPPA